MAHLYRWVSKENMQTAHQATRNRQVREKPSVRQIRIFWTGSHAHEHNRSTVSSQSVGDMLDEDKRMWCNGCSDLLIVPDDLGELLLGECKLQTYLKENPIKQGTSPRVQRPKLLEVRKHLTAALDRGNLKVTTGLKIKTPNIETSFIIYLFIHLFLSSSRITSRKLAC